MPDENNPEQPIRTTTTLDIHLGVTAQQLEEAGVLNVILGVDTQLFIDPRLLQNTDIPEFSTSKGLVDEYFNNLLRVNQQAHLTARVRELAISMIAIKEPKGLAIGYGNSRDSGTAIPRSVAVASLRSLNELLLVGINDTRVMEMLGLFIYRFGSDSISDLIAHIIYEDLCSFTQRVCGELGVATTRYTINGNHYELPTHPFKPHQIILLPVDLLSPLPVATSWEEIAEVARVNAETRRAFNDLVGENIGNFAKAIKRDPTRLTTSSENMQTLIDMYSNTSARPYDIDTDIRGYQRLTEFASRLERNSSTESTRIDQPSDMIDFIRDEIISRYRRHIEQLGANLMLYQRTGTQLRTVDPLKPLHEDASQILFHIVADDMCRLSNVMLSREPSTAAGAVDFSIGTGYRNKALVEIKKSTNNDLINGYTKQIERYLEAEAAAEAFYVVVIVRESDVSREDSKLNELKALHATRIREGLRTPQLEVINGLIRETASVPEA